MSRATVWIETKAQNRLQRMAGRGKEQRLPYRLQPTECGRIVAKKNSSTAKRLANLRSSVACWEESWHLGAGTCQMMGLFQVTRLYSSGSLPRCSCATHHQPNPNHHQHRNLITWRDSHPPIYNFTILVVYRCQFNRILPAATSRFVVATN